MPNQEKQFHIEKDKVRLLHSEKDAVLSRILENKPKKSSPVPSPFFHIFHYGVVPFLVLLLVSGPVAYAAQMSKPGDLLYSVEIKFIEPIEKTFYFSRESQIEYHTERLEERLEELKKMEKVQVETNDFETITQDVDDHVKAITTSLTKETKSEKKIKHLVKSKALIEAQGEILEDLDSSEDLSSEEIAEVLDRTSEEYATSGNAEEVKQTINEVVDDLTETASTTIPLKESVQIQIENINSAVQSGDLKEALRLANDIQTETLKQEYLEEETNPEVAE